MSTSAPLILVALAISTLAASAVENPGAVAETIRKRQRAEMIVAAKTWLATADLRPIPVPTLSADPKESERQEAGEIRDVNVTIERLQRLRDGKDSDAAVYEWFRRVEAGHKDIKAYMARKGGKYP